MEFFANRQIEIFCRYFNLTLLQGLQIFTQRRIVVSIDKRFDASREQSGFFNIFYVNCSKRFYSAIISYESSIGLFHYWSVKNDILRCRERNKIKIHFLSDIASLILRKVLTQQIFSFNQKTEKGENIYNKIFVEIADHVVATYQRRSKYSYQSNVWPSVRTERKRRNGKMGLWKEREKEK